MFLASDKARGAGSLFSAALIQATYGPLTREMVIMFGTYAQVAFRLFMGFLAITLFNILRRKFLRLPVGSHKKTVLLGVVWFGNVSLFTVSVTMSSIMTSVFVMYAASIIVSLILGVFVHKEGMQPMKIGAVVVALAGLAVYTHGMALGIGAIAALCAGILDGFANSIRKRLKQVEGYTLLQYQSAVCALVAFPVALVIPEQSIHAFSGAALVAGAAYGVLALGRNKLLHFGIHHFDMHAGTIILTTQLFFATLFGTVFYHEIPTFMQLAGGFIIFMAAALCIVSRQDIQRFRLRLALHVAHRSA